MISEAGYGFCVALTSTGYIHRCHNYLGPVSLVTHLTASEQQRLTSPAQSCLPSSGKETGTFLCFLSIQFQQCKLCLSLLWKVLRQPSQAAHLLGHSDWLRCDHITKSEPIHTNKNNQSQQSSHLGTILGLVNESPPSLLLYVNLGEPRHGTLNEGCFRMKAMVTHSWGSEVERGRWLKPSLGQVKPETTQLCVNFSVM